jgi:glycine hydroxymethyltransferase
MYNIENSLQDSDREICDLISSELKRQTDFIELIASENFTSKAVMEAQGSVLTNKYAEGYPAKRYYEGCEQVDEVEKIAIDRVTKLFKCTYANVQPHSGSQANQAVYLALLKPGDTILGMALSAGGHLTHGALPNMSGKWFKSVHYGVTRADNLIDYDELEKLALEHKPKLIIAGYSCYPRSLDFKRFREIADKVGAYLMADIAHIAGLVATNHHPSPFPYAHVVTSTTHKTLRGPRGGIILTHDEDIAKKINLAVFPGLQGGPLMHVIAAKAVAFHEAQGKEFKEYIAQVIKNSKALAKTLLDNEYNILTKGTDNHMVVVDLRLQGITGKEACASLSRAGITCNKNTVPFDNTSPFITSGIRLGSPACTTRGFKEKEFVLIGEMIIEILNNLRTNLNNSEIEAKILSEVRNLTARFPLYTR